MTGKEAVYLCMEDISPAQSQSAFQPVALLSIFLSFCLPVPLHMLSQPLI